jgi:acetoin utilization deacetylase AcuC-like enzyme
VLAVDLVMAGEVENAFCAVRPPGHHAERESAMGFCFFNNIAVAAAHALEGAHLSRVAVIDFDVHHGNGTEDCFKRRPARADGQHLPASLLPLQRHRSPAANMLNVPLGRGTDGEEFRRVVSDLWMPRLREFRPEMLFISAGFDAHYEDEMGGLRLLEKDYAWVTEQMKQVAEEHAQGRIVSMLEGGYSLSALARSVAAHIRVLAEL